MSARHGHPRGERRGRGAALFAAILVVAAAGTATAQITPIPRGASWKYHATGEDLGTEWRTPFYSDFNWPFGAAPLGYGRPGIVTTVPFGGDPANRHRTTYFRRGFSVNVNPATITSLVLEANYEDGFILYVNGVEAVRRSMPEGPVGYDSLAFPHEAGTFESIDLTAAVPLLQQGANFLAVELHKSAPDSPHLLWDASLTLSSRPVVTRGPYLQMGTPGGLRVRWRTNLPTASRVRYGPGVGDLPFTADSSRLTTEHEVELQGLQPDTRYTYAIGDPTTTLAGDDPAHTFVTSPLPGTPKPTRLWVIGDSGTGNVAAREVRDAYAAYAAGRAADAWLMLGDNAYPSGTDDQYQRAVFDMYRDLLRRTVVWPTRGNHDNVFAPPATDYFGIFSLPTAGEAGGLASGTESYYSFDYANIHFICLDSEGSDRRPSGAMLTWLRNDLAATDRTWIIAYWHHPPYSRGSHNSDDSLDSGGRLRDMRRHALPILEQGGVDLVLCGHSHSYERSMLLNGHYGVSTTLTAAMKVDPGDGRVDGSGPYRKPGLGPTPLQGAVYTVAGSSGGQTGGGSLDHPVMIASMPDWGSLVIDVEGPRLDARFLNNRGVVRDSFTIMKGGLLAAPGRDRSPDGPSVTGARPTPFGTHGTIAYAIPVRGAVRLSILDLGGRRVRTLLAGEREPGAHEVRWDGRDDAGRRLGAGVYFAVLEHRGATAARKLVFAP